MGLKYLPSVPGKLKALGIAFLLLCASTACTYAFSSYAWHWAFAVVFSFLMIGRVHAAARNEERSTRVFDLKRGSVAFLIGDLGLVVAIGFLAASHRDQAYSFGSLLAIGTVAGLVSVVIFRLSDRHRYIRNDDTLHLFYYSPSKVEHDFGTVFGLAASLAVYGAPLRHELSWHIVPAMFGVLVWLTCCGIDGMYPPNPRDQHGPKKSKTDKI